MIATSLRIVPWRCESLWHFRMLDTVTILTNKYSAFFKPIIKRRCRPQLREKCQPYSFSDCSSLTSIIIPSSVTSLGENCFMCSFNLKSIYFKGMDPKYLSEAFIPTTCRIYVLDEYLVDYKYALGTDYMYIYTWNPKE